MPRAAAASAPASLPDGGRFTALDSWRGLAALAVALRHIQGPGPLLSGQAHGNLSMAVDFFFVLSGFVVAASYGDRLTAGFSTLRFMLLRYGRVWPLHALLVVAYLALEAAAALGAGGALAGHAPFTGPRDPAVLVPTLLLWQEWLFPFREGWVAPSWSISVEIGLYFGAALLWRFAGRPTALIAAVVAVAAIALLDLGAEGRWYYALRGVGGFGLGVAGWSLWRRRGSAPRPLLAALELAAFPAVLVAIAVRAPYAVADPLFLLVVLVFACEAGPVSRLLRWGPFVWLGTLSYSLYMVHSFVFGRIMDLTKLAQQAAGAQWVGTRFNIDYLLLETIPALLAAAAMLLVVLGVAWLAWRFVEWPAREWSRRQARKFGAGAEERQAPAI